MIMIRNAPSPAKSFRDRFDAPLVQLIAEVR